MSTPNYIDLDHFYHKSITIPFRDSECNVRSWTDIRNTGIRGGDGLPKTTASCGNVNVMWASSPQME